MYLRHEPSTGLHVHKGNILYSIFFTAKKFSQNIFLLKKSFQVGDLLRAVHKEESIYNFTIKTDNLNSTFLFNWQILEILITSSFRLSGHEAIPG